jgi:hypothetical protein
MKTNTTKTQPELSRLLHVATTMPPLPHYADRERKFRIQDSQAAAWLAAQPDLWQWLFTACATRSLIVFDLATRTWRGNPARLKPVAHHDDQSKAGGGWRAR